MAELSRSQSQNKRTGKQGSGRRSSNRFTRSSRTRRQTGSSSVPPVMVRGGLAGLVLDAPKRKKSKPRRRFDLAIGANGAEMRLPGIPQVAVGWRFVSGLLMTALLALLFHLWNSPMYQINQLEINGLRRLDTRDVAAILGLNGETIFSVDVNEFEQRLADTFPEFSAVTVEVGLPAAVEITVEERHGICFCLSFRRYARRRISRHSHTIHPCRDGFCDPIDERACAFRKCPSIRPAARFGLAGCPGMGCVFWRCTRYGSEIDSVQSYRREN